MSRSILIVLLSLCAAAGCGDAVREVQDLPADASPDVVPDAGPVDVQPDGGGDVVFAPAWPVINEIAPEGVPDDWFEVFNGTGRVVDLGAYTFTDSLRSRKNVAAFPAGTIMQPGDHAVFRFSDAWPGFGLGAGEELGLIGPGGELVDGVDWTSVPAGKSISRLPDGTGPFADSGCETPGSANMDGTCDMPLPSDFLFDRSAVADVEITLSQASIDSLWADGHIYVAGQVRITSGGFDSGTMDAGVKLKGRYGSYSTLDGKSAFKIKLDFGRPGYRMLGLDVLNLNNFQQDCSMIHEHLAYRLFRAFGVPALRTGWARVSVNGQPYGVYLLLERYDDNFFRQWYRSTEHVYEGAVRERLDGRGRGRLRGHRRAG